MTDALLPKAERDLSRDGLYHIMELQEELQQFLYGARPRDLTLEDKIQFIWTMHTAAGSELNELLDEVGWKPWATARFINTEKAQGELIDVLHFVISLALALGMTPAMVYDKYIEKQERNRARQRDGYTGVDEKCVTCSRDLTDVEVASGLKSGPSTVLGRKCCGECITESWAAPK